MSAITVVQIGELIKQGDQGRITRELLQAFLENPVRFFVGLPVSYDQLVGLVSLIKRAVGKNNLGNIDRDIIQERFPLKGTGVRRVLCRVEAYLDGETSEQAAKRLTYAGHVLGNTGDLAGYLHDHPEEVEKWMGWVLAISEDSRWTAPGDLVLAPCANVRGAFRYFGLHNFRFRCDPHCGALVLNE